MSEVLCLGEALVDLISCEPGKGLEETKLYQLAPGGAVCNVAIGLARLGVKVSLITKLGLDPFGKFLLNFLKKEKVDISQIKISQQDLTALVFVALDKKLKPSFFFYGAPGSDRRLKPEELNPKAFQGIKLFHFGTISLSLEPVRSATLRGIALAERAKAKLSFDPNLRFHLWKDRTELKRLSWSLIPKADLIKLNQEELAFLTEQKELRKGAQRLLKTGVRIVVVTLGEKGAFFATENYDGFVPGFKFKPRDTTGAGDAFTSAMIAHLIRFSQFPPEKPELEKAVRFANAFAGLSTLKRGAIEGLKSFKEVEGFLKARARKKVP